MELEIRVFKRSGKYHTSAIVRNDIDIPIWKEEFKKFIRDSVPANIGEGFISVQDVSQKQSFNITLYRYDELFK